MVVISYSPSPFFPTGIEKYPTTLSFRRQFANRSKRSGSHKGYYPESMPVVCPG